MSQEFEATDTDQEYDRMEEAAFTGRVADLRQESGEPTDEYFHNLPVLEDIGHPLVPQVSHEFYDQDVTDNATLLDLTTFAMADDEYSTLLIGETGTGKNTIIDYICMNTHRPRVRVNFGVNITYDELVGHHSPDESSPSTVVNSMADMMDHLDDSNFEQGQVAPGEVLQSISAGNDFSWQDGILAMAVKYGWVFVGDEMNAAGGEVTTPLHGVTDDKDKRELVIRETGEVIEPHERFQFIGTMNPISYAGTKQVNQAFQDRFYCVEVDYLSEQNERELLQETTGVSEDEAASLVGFAADLRFKLGEDIMTPISPRDLMKVAKMAEGTGMSINESAKQILVPMADEGDRKILSRQIDVNL